MSQRTPQKNARKFIIEMSNKQVNKSPIKDVKISKDQEKRFKVKELNTKLQQALSENQILQSKVDELEALLSLAHDDIEAKDEAIIELYQMIENLGEKLEKQTNNRQSNSQPQN